MLKMSGLLMTLAVAGAGLASVPAFAENPLGLYVGASLGESTVRSGNYGYDGYNNFFGYGDHHFAWKAVAGVRPLSLIGAELEYIDFGHPGSDGGGYYNSYYYYGADSHPRAIAAFSVGYLPLPLPFLDVYGKVGAARLHTNVNGFDGPGCYANQPCTQNAVPSESVWDTRFAYGAGVQSKIWGVALRAEYERIRSPFGDPDMLSVGATWTF
jgi:hypothetical protein